jgi:hypothetical protein
VQRPQKMTTANEVIPIQPDIRAERRHRIVIPFIRGFVDFFELAKGQGNAKAVTTSLGGIGDPRRWPGPPATITTYCLPLCPR